MCWSGSRGSRSGRTTPTGGVRPAIAGKDRKDFTEFYDEYEAAQGFAGMGKDAAQLGTWVITGPITYIGQPALQRDIANLKAAMKQAGVKHGFLPVVAPASVVPARKDEHYRNEEEALFAIADALRDEYKMIVDAGLTVQVDDAYLASFYDVMVPPRSLADYRKWAAVRVEAVNHALRGIPEEQSRYHLCWGSWNGPHTNDVAIKDIIDLVLKIRVGGYSLEMANPRHEHEWRVWEKVKLPEGQGARSRPRQPFHQRGRASRIGRRAHRAPGQAGGARQRDREHRLRLRAGAVHAAGASLDHVGEAARGCRGRTIGDARALAPPGEGTQSRGGEEARIAASEKKEEGGLIDVGSPLRQDLRCAPSP